MTLETTLIQDLHRGSERSTHTFVKVCSASKVAERSVPNDCPSVYSNREEREQSPLEGNHVRQLSMEKRDSSTNGTLYNFQHICRHTLSGYSRSTRPAALGINVGYGKTELAHP